MKPEVTCKRLKCLPSRGDDDGEARPCPMSPPNLAWALWLKLRAIFSVVAVEPVMLLDGLGYSIMIVYVENIQMDKICLVNLNLTQEVCGNLSSYPEENIAMQQYFSVFGMYNGIIMAFLPLFFILFMGAWSDKYGRKVPLYTATLGHFCWALGYLINSWVTHWPVEYLLVAALMDSLGGGTVSFLTAANAYISDVTSEESRTTRVGLANSIWFLGGPIGTLLGTYIYMYGGYQILFGTSVMLHCISLTYLFFLPESHGPFAKNKMSKACIEKSEEEQPVRLSFKKPSEIEDDPTRISIWKMFLDFFNYERIVDSFRCTFKPRGGFVRIFILLLILCNLLRRLGRGAYMYLFTRKVLDWRETDYGLWVTYKNLIAALGSLAAVPLLSQVFNMSDNYLALLGAFSSVADYTLYGLVSENTEFLVWIAPTAALLVNSCVIAIRSILSKFVTGDELGKVSAVMGALDGVMPMISFSLYTAIYHATVKDFPGTQFFFGATANLLMTLIFIFIIVFNTTRSYSIEDLTTVEGCDAVKPTSLRFFSERLNNHIRPRSNTFADQDSADAQRTNIVLSGVNFHLGTPSATKKILKPSKSQTLSVLSTVSEMSAVERQRIQDEITNPQKYSTKLPSSFKREEAAGIDNAAYVTSEDDTSVSPSEAVAAQSSSTAEAGTP
ncbi:proton-coupled folate transporter-like isoform X2 [Portunus trituberculatus]|uniref:proton-coupled folate transporter-like isoform X2 n=1 Tax=Portunus trituberculatus TaxID=210409 RepID=UPI001E1CF716|nr:proton-coupled folate transporter-like isoform X2 [Portunus trituberculatus]